MASESSRRALYDKLLAAIDEFLEAYDDAAMQTPLRAAPGDQVTVAAGPFASTDELRSFQRSLSAIPGVSDVQVRGYEGSDRAVLDVTLTPQGHRAEDPR